MPGRHRNRSLKKATACWTPLQTISGATLAWQWSFVAKRGLVDMPLRQNLAEKESQKVNRYKKKKNKKIPSQKIYKKGNKEGQRQGTQGHSDLKGQ